MSLLKNEMKNLYKRLALDEVVSLEPETARQFSAWLENNPEVDLDQIRSEWVGSEIEFWLA